MYFFFPALDNVNCKSGLTNAKVIFFKVKNVLYKFLFFLVLFEWHKNNYEMRYFS